MRLIAPVSSSAPCPILASSVPRDRVLQQVTGSEASDPQMALPFQKREKFKREGPRQKGPPQMRRAFLAYLAPDGGVFSSGSLAASDPTYLMVLRGVSIVMIASPVAVKRLMPNV